MICNFGRNDKSLRPKELKEIAKKMREVAFIFREVAFIFHEVVVVFREVCLRFCDTSTYFGNVLSHSVHSSASNEMSFI